MTPDLLFLFWEELLAFAPNTLQVSMPLKLKIEKLLSLLEGKPD